MEEAEEAEAVETARGKKGLFSRGANRLGFGMGRGFTTEVMVRQLQLNELLQVQLIAGSIDCDHFVTSLIPRVFPYTNTRES